MDMLRITNLKKHFGDKEVLTGLNLSVPEHSVFGFVGENGAGKTTTMKIILGLLKSDRGEVFVSGERVKYGQTATNRYIGYLPDTLLFLGEQFKMFEVLEFITEHKILISKIERVEPSLESLFMEVVSK